MILNRGARMQVYNFPLIRICSIIISVAMDHSIVKYSSFIFSRFSTRNRKRNERFESNA